MSYQRATYQAKPKASIRTLWGIAKSPELGMTDEDLHALVYRETGKESIRKLSQGELNAVARVLQNLKDGARRPGQGKRTDEGGDPRTVELRRKIYHLMRELGWSERQVNDLARRMFRVERIEWLTPGRCGKLVEALKAILARKDRSEG